MNTEQERKHWLTREVLDNFFHAMAELYPNLFVKAHGIVDKNGKWFELLKDLRREEVEMAFTELRKGLHEKFITFPPNEREFRKLCRPNEITEQTEKKKEHFRILAEDLIKKVEHDVIYLCMKIGSNEKNSIGENIFDVAFESFITNIKYQITNLRSKFYKNNKENAL